MIPAPVFLEAQRISEIGAQLEGVCGVCDQPVETVALVGIMERPTIQLAPDVSMKPPGADRAFMLLGPCGHSHTDTGYETTLFTIRRRAGEET